MAVDLGDLIDSVKREVNPPGVDGFPNATDDTYFGYLQDAFWEARLDGVTLLANFNNTDGVIAPVSVGGADITGDLLQLLVVYSGIRILRNQIINAQDLRAKAGAVEYETRNAASVMVRVLDELKARRNIILLRLSDLGAVPSYYIDSLMAREESISWGDTYFASGGFGSRGYPYGGNDYGGW